MRFESKETRSFIVRAVLGLVPDIIIALTVAIVSKEGIWAFLAIIFGLQILYLLLWIKNSIWGWAWFHFMERKKLSSRLLDYLDTNKYPKPNEYLKDAISYFDGIINDGEQDHTLRIKAAAEIGSLSILQSSGHTSQYLRMIMAYEDAIEQYEKLCRSREK